MTTPATQHSAGDGTGRAADLPPLPTLAELDAAAALVHDVLPPTPQYRWPVLEQRAGNDIALWVKHENHAPTAAFKVRGGLVYLDWLHRAHPQTAGIALATRGNHGQSLAFAAQRHGIPVTIVVPHGNSVEKNAAMRALGAELITDGHDFQASLEVATDLAARRGLHMVPSFHPLLVRGVGTYAMELLRAVPDLDTVYVPIGQGSGICGVIAARDALGLRTRVVGVVSSHAPAFARSIVSGTLTSHDVTTRIADGMACRTPVASALAHVARGAERILEVSDDEVEDAMRLLYTATHNVAEGAGAAALAALLQERDRMRGARVAVVLTGGNVDASELARVLSAAG